MTQRGEVWWAGLEEPRASEPGFRRPVLIVQADSFNRSRLHTVLAILLSSNLRLVDAPGNALLPAEGTGLPKDSVAVVTQLVTLERSFLGDRVGMISRRLMAEVEAGLRLVLDL